MVKEIESVVVRRGRKEGAGMDWEGARGPPGVGGTLCVSDGCVLHGFLRLATH